MRYIIYFYSVVDKKKKCLQFLRDKTKRIEAEDDASAIRKCKRHGGALLIRVEKRGKNRYKRESIYRSKIFD